MGSCLYIYLARSNRSWIDTILSKSGNDQTLETRAAAGNKGESGGTTKNMATKKKKRTKQISKTVNIVSPRLACILVCGVSNHILSDRFRRHGVYLYGHIFTSRSPRYLPFQADMSHHCEIKVGRANPFLI